MGIEQEPKPGKAPAIALICAECGAESPPDSAGWRAYLDADDTVAVFCPRCAEREFGER